jgi:hypothetical protein
MESVYNKWKYRWTFVTPMFRSGKVIIEMRTKLDKRDDFNFPIVNFLNNIPAAPANGVYISQLIPFFKLCGSYQDFLDAVLAPLVAPVVLL